VFLGYVKTRCHQPRRHRTQPHAAEPWRCPSAWQPRSHHARMRVGMARISSSPCKVPSSPDVMQDIERDIGFYGLEHGRYVTAHVKRVTR